MKKIICVGNRFAYPDNFGMVIYEALQNLDTQNIEIIEGGIGGLSLLPHFQTNKPILLVDFGMGFEKNLLTKEEICTIQIQGYSHDTSLLYLLKSIENENILFYLCNNAHWKEEDIALECKEVLKIAREM